MRTDLHNSQMYQQNEILYPIFSCISSLSYQVYSSAAAPLLARTRGHRHDHSRRCVSSSPSVPHFVWSTFLFIYMANLSRRNMSYSSPLAPLTIIIICMSLCCRMLLSLAIICTRRINTIDRYCRIRRRQITPTLEYHTIPPWLLGGPICRWVQPFRRSSSSSSSTVTAAAAAEGQRPIHSSPQIQWTGQRPIRHHFLECRNFANPG